MPTNNTEYSRIWRAKNPERAREHSRRWHAKNKEKTKEYRLQNKEHINKRMRAWKKANREKVTLIERRRLLKRKYGITLDQYEALSASQGHGCAICGSHRSNETGENLVVDHCHDSGKVRGLLCNRCNRGVGLLQDDPAIVGAALRYLSGKREKVA